MRSRSPCGRSPGCSARPPGAWAWGVFALATAAVALRTGVVLPRWLAIVIAVVGASLLTPVSYVGELTGGALIVVALTIAVVLLGTPVEDGQSVEEPRAR